MNEFIKAVKNRRSIYGITNESVIPDSQLEGLLTEAVKHTPSAFNSQSARVVILLNEHHNTLWDIITDELRKIVPKDKFDPTLEKMNGFKAGYGTILFFEDQSVIKQLQDDYKLYEDKFPIWSYESSGMLQFVIWTALEEEGYGANLQHYNPIIDDKVKSEWNIPEEWKLVAQMPFGKPTQKPGDKDFKPIENRLKVYK